MPTHDINTIATNQERKLAPSSRTKGECIATNEKGRRTEARASTHSCSLVFCLEYLPIAEYLEPSSPKLNVMTRKSMWLSFWHFKHCYRRE
ncbi:hypothetical protein I7I50_06494 [Histoplasma capsulatum G186AR]|uniref:Uncharacterized protein n=1 Tax=Ajellomyces capsulatus TaxID=5037 RepID=A0A8H7Z179_AJECA|nr:hypothetical protein I7I52_10434 [Histoplasma capsulatum]QSS67419.1 hypothetical protein I7I50_06494 [Histoplasma capsulatum G186AR]